jgi:lipopolysaccharide export system permease protein
MTDIMPIVWRYLIKDFLKISLACVFAFVAILLTMRMNEIAHFAALGAPLTTLLFFTLYQIPYILPIALPLSSLIASFLTIQRLSYFQECTALRASGFSILHILTPIWIVAAFFAIGNFWITSEFATQSHLKANILKNELRSINPLLLLQNKHLMRLKGFYFEILGSSHVGESAQDVILAFPNRHQGRLNILIAKQLITKPIQFIGEKVTLITGTESQKENDFDDLYIENMQSSTTNIRDFSYLLENKVFRVGNDYLKFSLLLSRLEDVQQDLQQSLSPENLRAKIKERNQIFSEMIKRLSLALAVFTFTVLGTTCGMSIGRRKHNRSVYFAISLSLLFLICFFAAKGIDNNVWIASFLYLFPHLFIILTSMLFLKRIARGIE